MKSTKKLLALMLASAIALSATACAPGGAASSAAPPPPASDADPAVSTPAADPAAADISKEVALDFYFVGNKEEADTALISEELSKLTKEKINATVKLHTFDWGSYQKKIDMMLASGEKIDIVSTVGLPFPQMVAKGSFLDVNSLYADYGKDMAQYMIDASLEGCKVNGGLYGIPTPKEAGGCYGYVIRKDMVEGAGIDLSTVKTMADMTAVWKAMKAKYPEFSVVNPRGMNDTMSQIGFQQVGDGPGRIYRNIEAKVVNEYEQPVFTEITNIWSQWYKDGYINKETTNKNFAHTAALRDNTAHAIGGQCKNGIEAEVSAGVGGKYEFTKVILETPIALTFSGYECALSVPKAAANPERSMMFINLLFSDSQIHDLVNFGILDRNYEITADGRIQIPAGANPDSLTYNPNMVWQLGNALISKWWTTYPLDHVEKMKAYNASVEPSVALGFAFDSEPVKTEIAACLNVANEYEIRITTGQQAPAEYLDEMLSKYKAAGIDKVIAEKQAQLDKWAASK